MRSPNKHEIIESMKKRPHLFILGAGATKATIPNGDKNGRQSPVMDNFLQEIGLSDLLKKVILKTQSNNIENILAKKWEPFVQETNYHLNIHRSLLDTLISEFPRRSIEGYTKRYIEGWWGNSTLTLKECTSFSMLRQLFEPLIVNEKNNNYNVI